MDKTFNACIWKSVFNPLTPNDHYSARTAPVTSKHCLLYIYSTNIGTEYLKHGIYSHGHILRRNCLLKQVIEGKIKGQIEVTRSQGRRRKKLLDDLKDRRGYCELKVEALDRTMWRNRFARGFGPVV